MTVTNRFCSCFFYLFFVLLSFVLVQGLKGVLGLQGSGLKNAGLQGSKTKMSGFQGSRAPYHLLLGSRLHYGLQS